MRAFAGGNPAFKVYDIDPDSYEIMDVRSYYSAALPLIHYPFLC